ncbi:hypothetical protein GCM10010376_44900 [Streptomyces violaceusniger]
MAVRDGVSPVLPSAWGLSVARGGRVLVRAGVGSCAGASGCRDPGSYASVAVGLRAPEESRPGEAQPRGGQGGVHRVAGAPPPDPGGLRPRTPVASAPRDLGGRRRADRRRDQPTGQGANRVTCDAVVERPAGEQETGEQETGEQETGEQGPEWPRGGHCSWRASPP